MVRWSLKIKNMSIRCHWEHTSILILKSARINYPVGYLWIMIMALYNLIYYNNFQRGKFATVLVSFFMNFCVSFFICYVRLNAATLFDLMTDIKNRFEFLSLNLKLALIKWHLRVREDIVKDGHIFLKEY